MEPEAQFFFMNPSQIDSQIFPRAKRSIDRLVRNAMGSHPLEEVLGCPEAQPQQQENEKRPRPHPEKALKCPRCDSTNTKFCYYNNYSLSQPRYFCKDCGRYWTQGGSLRNVPVGGGCRRKKRSSSSSSSSCKRPRGQTLFTNPNPFLPIILPRPSIPYDLNDPSLAITGLHNPPPSTQLGLHDHNTFLLGNPNPNLSYITSTPTPGFLDIRRSGLLDSTNLNGFHNLYFGFGSTGNVGEVVGGGEEMVVPFEEGLSGGATTTSFPATATSSQRYCRFIDGGKNNVVVGHTPVARRWGRQLGCGSRERVLEWGGEEMPMPFEGGLGGGARTSSSSATTTANNRSCRYIDGGKNNEVVGLQCHASGEGSLAVDQRREHWTGVGSSSWHGLINNSLMGRQTD